jgi:hypothetical protein
MNAIWAISVPPISILTPETRILAIKVSWSVSVGKSAASYAAGKTFVLLSAERSKFPAEKKME